MRPFFSNAYSDVKLIFGRALFTRVMRTVARLYSLAGSAENRGFSPAAIARIFVSSSAPTGSKCRASSSALENVKAHGMVAPLARWPKPLDTPVNEWVGLYGLPVPASLDHLSETPSVPGYTVTLTTWRYGDVAEILHIGPYGAEMPTVEKLKAFIAASGYQIAGPHEEEYLRGPGMFGKGDPQRYYTIIRYQVVKKAMAQPKSSSQTKRGSRAKK